MPYSMGMKTTFKEIVEHSNYSVNSKIYDIGRQAEIVQKIASEHMEENGEFAKMHCSNIIDWMQDIADQAQKLIEISLENSESYKWKSEFQ